MVSTTKGRRKRKRYVVEVDGQLFQAESISHVESIFQQVRALAEESAERDVTTPVTPKPPRITVKTRAGKASTSQVIQQEVKRTQTVINRAYIRAAKAIAQNREISELLIRKFEQEDEEEALILLLM